MYTVAGVLEDIPRNSQLQFDALCSMNTFDALSDDGDPYSWTDNWLSVYIMLHDKTDGSNLKTKLHHILKTFWKETTENQLFMRPLLDVHLHSTISGDFAFLGSMKNIRIFFIIALTILFMAGVNYTNLATAQAIKHSKQAALRLIIGAPKKNVILQFFIESLIILIAALIFGFLLVEIFTPWFNNLVQRELKFEFLNNPQLLVIIISVTILLGFLSSLYPAYLISNFQPLLIFKGKVSKTVKTPFFRKALVALQFLFHYPLLLQPLE